MFKLTKSNYPQAQYSSSELFLQNEMLGRYPVLWWNLFNLKYKCFTKCNVEHKILIYIEGKSK